MQLLVLCFVIASAIASCPCSWDSTPSTLDCSRKGLQLVPTLCFTEFPAVKNLVLDGNEIEKLFRDDFINATLIEQFLMSDNPLIDMHPDTFTPLTNLQYVTILSDSLSLIQSKLFWHNSNLIGVNLGRAFISLPKELFSPNLTNVIRLDFSFAPLLSVIPCKMIEQLHPESYVNASGSVFWAQSPIESQNCLGRPNFVSQCFLVSTNFTACDSLVQEISPLVTRMALGEVERSWYPNAVPDYVTFPISFEGFSGTPPDPLSCLPQGIDKIWDFQLYYRNSEHVYLDTLFFDLVDLRDFTSSITQSVTIKADTVVLSRDIPAIEYKLKIAAREIALQHPIKSLTNTAFHSPATDINYYTAAHQFEEHNGLIIERYIHANIEIILLNSPAMLCEIPPEVVDVEAISSLTQLDLTIQCAKNIMTNNPSDAQETLKMAEWAEKMSTSNPARGMQQIRSRATSLIALATSVLTNDTRPHPLSVPYLSLQVYSDMVDDLSQNVQYYMNTMDTLRDKLERQAEAMFDMSISFVERRADLEFVYQNSMTAFNQAKNVYGSHQNHLNNLLSHADSAYGLVFDTYDMFDASVSQYNAAIEKFSFGLELAYANGFIRGCANFFVNLGKCFKGKAKPSDVVNSIYEASDYSDEIRDMQDELANAMELVNELMENVNAIMVALQTLDPEGTGDIDWAAAFPDTTALVNAAGGQFVSRNQWDISTRGALILLDDDDMKKVYGANDYKIASLQLAEWGKRLSEKVVSFSLLILQIKDEEENLKVDELAVEQASEKIDTVGNMMSSEVTNQQNYLEVMKSQNVVIMGLMLDFYTRIRADMLIMASVIDEFCSAHVYNFFLECSPETRPVAEDGYAEIIAKLSKLQVGALDSISSLNPPPQPFTKVYDIDEALFPICVGFMENCPITSLKVKGTTSFVLSDWWETELSSFDRVRIDKLQFFLVGATTLVDSSVIIEVKHPSVFNDTFQGNLFTFTGPATECLIMYRQGEGSESIVDASYITDCSTHQSYENYYSRSTPGGLYTLTVVSPDTDVSKLNRIQVHVEGSWMPHSEN